MTKITLKEISIILVLAVVTAFVYNTFASSGVNFLYTEEKLKTGEIVSVERAKLIFDEESAIFIDARPMYSYQRGHIPGAINIPYSSRDKASLMKDISKDENIITYCYSAKCNQARILVRDLKKMGYTNVALFEGGIVEWKKAGYPLTSVNEKKKI